MFCTGTPADCIPATISLTISGEEQQAGAPEGLILMPTMSFGSMNLLHASRTSCAPVNSHNARSSIRRMTGCETRLDTIAWGSATSTTRPGKSPGMRKGEGCVPAGSFTYMGGAGGMKSWLYAVEVAQW